MYLLIKTDALPPVGALGVGLLSMALAWAAGTSLEGRRRGTSKLVAAVGVAEVILIAILGSLGAWRYLLLATAILSGAAWIALRKPK